MARSRHRPLALSLSHCLRPLLHPVSTLRDSGLMRRRAQPLQWRHASRVRTPLDVNVIQHAPSGLLGGAGGRPHPHQLVIEVWIENLIAVGIFSQDQRVPVPRRGRIDVANKDMVDAPQWATPDHSASSRRGLAGRRRLALIKKTKTETPRTSHYPRSGLWGQVTVNRMFLGIGNEKSRTGG